MNIIHNIVRRMPLPRLPSMRIGQRLGAGFAITLISLLAMTLLGTMQLRALSTSMEHVINQRYPGTMIANTIKSDLFEATAAMDAMTREEEAQQVPALATSVEQSTQFNSEGLDKLQHALASDGEGMKLLQNVLGERKTFLAAQQNFLKLATEGKRSEALFAMRNVRNFQVGYFQTLDALILFQSEQVSQDGSAVLRSAKIALWAMAILAGCACLLGLIVSVSVTRSITRPLKLAVQIAERVAGGDLRCEIPPGRADETGQLLNALRNMNSSLAGIVAEVRSGTETIALASTEIAAGNQDLSERTEEQASTLQRSARVIEQLAEAVSENAAHVERANQLGLTASEVALKGGKIVAEVVQTMSVISGSSKKVVDIISVIDGIAFQTNILALNAAVEAARAGEQGRGFAVVASEVRALAHRSANAAKEIKQLIGESVGKIDDGSQLVSQAGNTMDAIVDAVRKVVALLGDIAQASQEQSRNIVEVNRSMTQMDETTQQNAALVEEAAAAACSLQEQAGMLEQAVSVFQLADEAQQVAPVLVAQEGAALSRSTMRALAPPISA